MTLATSNSGDETCASASTAMPPRYHPIEWWAHLDFTRMNIALTILQNQIEEFSQLDVGRSCFDEAEISPSGPRELCVHRASHMRFTSSPP